MNNFGNRGFGGPPQPQRQGGRRGMNRGGGNGGFRNSRFDHNNQRPNQGSPGGQRPNNEQGRPVEPSLGANNKPQAAPQQLQQPKPQPIKETVAPVQNQQPKPVQPAQTAQSPLNKPAANTPAPAPVAQANGPAKLEQAQNANQNKPTDQQNNQQQQQKPVNGTFGGNNPNNTGSWNQGGPGNKQSGPNQGGFNQGSFNQGNRQGGPFGGSGGPRQGGPGGPRHGGPGQGGPGGARQGGPGQGGPGGPRHGGPGQGQGWNPQRNNMRNQLDGMKPAQREEHILANKLKDLVGPLLDLAPIEQEEVKFNGRSRLYIGNLPNDVTEEEIQKMFSAFGEPAELFLNKEKNFGFIKMDYRVNAEKAKRELDGQNRNGRTLRVRFAPHNSAVHVKNLPPFVSNELLYRAFEIFGKIERAYVKVDDRGKTLGEGVVEYARKPSALAAIRNCTEKCFFLTSSLRPVIVESYEEPDEIDGYPEKNLPKKHPEFLRAREVGPRFSEPNSFEHEYGTRWKQLHELHHQKEETLKKELAAEEEKLEAQMEYAKYEHETEMLREQLRQREEDRERQKRSWEMAERAADERQKSERAQLTRQEEELSQRMRNQDDELRRRQKENTLFVQAQRLNSMLDRQEQGMFDQQSPMDGGFRDQFERPRGGFDDMQNRGWEGPRPLVDDFPNKRRRF